MKYSLLTFFLTASLISMGCAHLSSFTSSESSEPIYADGDLEEWAENLIEYEDGRLKVGVQHDANFVYLALWSSDRILIQQIMAAGFTVWLNQSGDKQQDIGIRFPLGINNVREQDPSRGSVEETEEARRVLLLRSTTQYDLYFEQGKPLRRQVGSDGRFQLGSSYNYGVFAAEFAIPLTKSSGSEVFVDPIDGVSFGLGLQSPEASSLGSGRARIVDRNGTEMGVGGGRQGSGRSSVAGVPVFAPIDLWITVSLETEY